MRGQVGVVIGDLLAPNGDCYLWGQGAGGSLSKVCHSKEP